MAEIGTVLLAAGLGSRFGAAPKLLARLDGKPLVRHAAEAALGARPRPVVAVLGAHAEAVRDGLAGLDLVRVDNPDYRTGLASSLRAGLAALPATCAAAIVVLGDMPRVTAAHLDRLAEAFAGAPELPAAVVPVQAGRRGNPVLLNLRRLGPDIARLAGDRGAGPLLKGRSDVLEIPGDPATALDVDTPDTLAALGGQRPAAPRPRVAFAAARHRSEQ
ncbi:nucleotidyltransferase family protein [Methylobacterium radiotolerans]|uniref:nucleotidyltransferase family protein n=1 Tax=Methylobacterium radiotolerans TaxID=31998 RepID=UPI000D5F4948|nr:MULTISPECIES: nucleotidyltransferase family protein [Methylobacterium]MDE3750150.1 nucleotidyltransferase family protein [Methylobacterium radiotolerans]PVY87286.1 molybdenum cofactor cytidylyltransferase [Methylobacterium organophilum]